MKYSIHKHPREDLNFLEVALLQKARFLKATGIDKLPAIFDLGDKVGFFFGPTANDHSVGVIVAEGNRHVTVQSEDGKMHKVSPFLLFALPGEEADHG